MISALKKERKKKKERTDYEKKEKKTEQILNCEKFFSQCSTDRISMFQACVTFFLN